MGLLSPGAGTYPHLFKPIMIGNVLAPNRIRYAATVGKPQWKEKTMKVNKVDHICVAVRDLDAATKVWEPIMGKPGPDETYIDEPEKIRVARYWLGGVGFALIESAVPDGPVAKWIEKNGEGVMSINFNVDSTREAIKELESNNYPFIPGPGGEKARPFREGEFAFIHPKKMNNVLLELIDYKWDELKEK